MWDTNSLAYILQCNLERIDAKDIPECISVEIVDLVELFVPINLQKDAAKSLLDLTHLEGDASLFIKSYFNL
jgi:hypothetical protein